MPLSGNTGGSASANYVRVINQLAAGIDNGGTVGATWNTVPLNSITHNEGNLIALAANVMTLQPGVYRAFCFHGGYAIGRNRIRLNNQTDSVLYLGTNTFTPNGNDPKSFVVETFSIANACNLSLELYTTTTQATTAMGRAQNMGGIDEQYTVCEFIQIGSS